MSDHEWAHDCEGQLYCRVCWLPYSHWIGDPCPGVERALARLPEWRPPHPAPATICPDHPDWMPNAEVSDV